MDKDLVDQVIDTALRVVASGAISANGHGNVSIRVPGAQEMYYTAAPSLREHPRSAFAYFSSKTSVLMSCAGRFCNVGAVVCSVVFMKE